MTATPALLTPVVLNQYGFDTSHTSIVNTNDIKLDFVGQYLLTFVCRWQVTVGQTGTLNALEFRVLYNDVAILVLCDHCADATANFTGNWCGSIIINHTDIDNGISFDVTRVVGTATVNARVDNATVARASIIRLM